MNEWFGPAGGAPYEDDTPHVETPVGEACGRCGEVFVEGDAGVTAPRLCEGDWKNVAYHYECNLRAVIGGANHLMKRCTCCGGTEPPDPPEYTTRQAAQFAVAVWSAMNTLRATFGERKGNDET